MREGLPSPSRISHILSPAFSNIFQLTVFKNLANYDLIFNGLLFLSFTIESGPAQGEDMDLPFFIRANLN